MIVFIIHGGRVAIIFDFNLHVGNYPYQIYCPNGHAWPDPAGKAKPHPQPGTPFGQPRPIATLMVIGEPHLSQRGRDG